MLLGNLYNITSQRNEENQFYAEISINASHEIFTGHFPGQPILPGVCMMQMVREMLEQQVHQKLQVSEAANMKFTAMLDPTVHASASMSISYTASANYWAVKASLTHNELTFFSFSGTIKSVSAEQ